MLFTPYRLGRLTLPNRIVMPPMTRARAGAGHVPAPMMADYYAQRASAGLIITEGTQISPQGQGYAWMPCTRPAVASLRNSGMWAASRIPHCSPVVPRRCRRHRWWPKA